MTSSPLLTERQRPLRVCYYHYDHRFIDDTLECIEGQLAKIHAFEMVELTSLDSAHFDPCDLLVLIAHQLPPEALTQWVQGLPRRLNHKIWTPALIIAAPGLQVASELTSFALQSNWYFDIVDAEHITSLSLRMSNLIRIHDHLHEMYRYEKTLGKLEEKIQKLAEHNKT